MPATSPSGRSVRPWLMWAAPLAVLVLLAAVAGGMAARRLYGSPERPTPPATRRQTSEPPESPPGPARVELSPSASRHPDHAAVRTLLQNYFEAINLMRYDQWKATVVREKQRQQPEEQWRSDYASTQDGSILVHRIVPGPNGSLRVMMTFTSTQDPADAPAKMPVKCLRWHVVYPVVRVSGRLRIGAGLPASSLYRPC